MKASILTIGDEILIGQIVDTNSASIARHLNNAGIVVWERTSVGDQREQITEAVKRAMNQSDVVILTGGLGPTKDDITKKTLAELFGSRLVCDQTVADHVRRMLEARGIEYNRLNRDQALVPACCTVLFNAHGTAPGMWFEQNGKVVVSLPGVPFEMEHLMTDEVMPRLKARFSLRQIVHRTLITAGLAESMLAEKIADWENCPAPVPPPGISARTRRGAAAPVGLRSRRRERIARNRPAIRRPATHHSPLRPRIRAGDHAGDRPQPADAASADSRHGRELHRRQHRSPLHGNARSLGLFPVRSGGLQQRSKNNLLGVDPETIASRGAVSEEVARQMAEGARRITGADYAVATTGIAGPAGGTEQKPVGTVWMAVAGPHRTVTLLKQCGTDRGQVIDRASAFALALLRDEIERDAAGE